MIATILVDGTVVLVKSIADLIMQAEELRNA